VDEVLDASRAEYGGLSLSLEVVDLFSLANECLMLNKGAAERQGAQLSLQVDVSPPNIRLDRAMMLRVINELLNNAIRFSGPSGKVELRLSAGKRRVEVTVADNGPGIRPGDLKKLFKPFPKDSRFRRPGERGIGLGLAIAKAIVTAHRGR